MTHSDPTAAPFFPLPFRVDSFRSVTPRRSGPSSSRSSTPVRPPPSARSSSTSSVRTPADEDAALLDRKRADSVRKVVTAWDLLKEKYGAIGVNEDDEIDIRTGKITKNRGRVVKMVPRRDIGLDSEDEEEGEEEAPTATVSEESVVESDEDELGSWETVDPQTRPPPPTFAWTEQDQEELEEFLRAEEARKRLDSEQDQEVESNGWSSDDEGEEAGTSRSTSPELGIASGAEADESEDELLATDEEASRKTPLLSRRRSMSVEVVIPFKPRPRGSDQSFASLPPEQRPTMEAAPSSQRSRRSNSSQTLRDLFTPPPGPDEPVARVILSGSHASASSQRPRSVSNSSKGKARMASERPHESLPIRTSHFMPEELAIPSDEERYFQTVHRVNKRWSKYCRNCLASTTDPIRKQRAWFCKGRVVGEDCTFAQQLGEKILIDPNLTRKIQPRRRHSTNQLCVDRRATREASGSGDDNRAINEAEGETSEKPSAPTPAATSRSAVPSRLAPQAAESSDDQEGAELAVRLRAMRQRRSRRNPINRIKSSTPAPATSSGVATIEEPPTTSQEPRESTFASSTDSDTDSWMNQVFTMLPREMRDVTQEPMDIRPRRRKVRQSNSELSSLPPSGLSESTASAQSGAPISSTPEREVRPARAIPIGSSARKRIITPLSVSPAPDASCRQGRQATTPTSSPLSPPASSPAKGPSSHFFHPTPSPTASAEPDKKDSTAVLLWPPTSPTKRRILPLPRGSHYAPQPTPPPSTDSRTSSTSCDRISLEGPRSILRAPSTLPGSHKRARFSLQPSSPGIDVSDMFAQSENGSQDFESETNSPWQISHIRDADSSSPFFSKEFSVRAADVGFQPGPGHTGRLTQGMLQALSSTAVVENGTPPQLLSRDSRSPKPYTLSAPPRMGTPGRTMPSPSKGGSTAGLMLPPPVPPRRQSGVGSNASAPSTPSKATPPRDSPIFNSKSPKTPSTVRRRAAASSVPVISPESEPIIFKTAIPASVLYAQAKARSRSRSRSVSAVPSSRSDTGSQMTRERKTKPSAPSTTPRKRYRDRSERELARLARELGDEAGLEWGMDEDVGQEIAREGREGTVFMYLD